MSSEETGNAELRRAPSAWFGGDVERCIMPNFTEERNKRPSLGDRGG